MSYPDPPNQPPWGAPGPPGGGQFQPPPAGAGYAPAPGPPRGSSRAWMIPVAAGLAVVTMAGTVWAATSLAQNYFVGAHPASVMPGSAIAFAQLDLQPSGGQLTDYAQFVEKLPDSMRDEIDPEADPAQELVDSVLENSAWEGMSYEEDFEPWLGQRFGFSAWMPDNEDAADSTGTAAVLALEVEDEGAAEETLTEMQGQTEEMAFDIRDDFAVITDKSAVLSDLESQIESGGTLEEQENYTSDMEAIGTDNIASAWMDLGKASALAEESSSPGTGGYGDMDQYGGLSQPDPLGSLQDYDDVSGRMALGLGIEADYVELRADAFEMSADGVSMADYTPPEPGLGLMGDLPDDTMMAFSGSGMADLIGQAYKENPDQFADLDGLMADLGLSMPGGMTSLLGDKTALGITDLGGSIDEFFGGATGTPSLQFRAKGADSAAVEDAIEEMYANSYSTPPGVTSEGSTTIATSGTTGTGRLGDDPVFKQTMAGTESAHAGMYLDLRPFAESAEESSPEQWGAIGAALTLDESTVSMTARWAPNGGG